MAIQPVMNYVTGANKYNTSFTGKKDDNKVYATEVPSISTNAGSLKAVPLAVMLAMSPLAANNLNAAEKTLVGNNIEMVDVKGVDEIEQNKRIVASKTFVSNTEGYDHITVNLINTKGGNGFDEVQLVTSKNMNGFIRQSEDELLGININNFTIISDDGVNQGTVTVKNLKYRPEIMSVAMEATHHEVVEYIQSQLAKNPKKNIIPVNTHNKKVSLTLSGLTTKVKGNILDASKGIDLSQYVKTANPRVIHGDNGNYTIGFYKNKNDGKTIVTCTKSTNPNNAFKVSLIVEQDAYFQKEHHSAQGIRYVETILDDVNGNPIHLIDKTLAKELINYSKSNFAVVGGIPEEYSVRGAGLLLKVPK